MLSMCRRADHWPSWRSPVVARRGQCSIRGRLMFSTIGNTGKPRRAKWSAHSTLVLAAVGAVVKSVVGFFIEITLLIELLSGSCTPHISIKYRGAGATGILLAK